MTPSQQLRELGITLPPAPEPVGSYMAGTRTGNLVLCSGQIPVVDGRLIAAGKVGRDLTLEEAQTAARQCVMNALSITSRTAGGLDRVRRVVRLAVYVNSAAGFTDQPKVANAASDLVVQIFGECGRHVRAAIGCNELPLNAAVELELMAEVSDGEA